MRSRNDFVILSSLALLLVMFGAVAYVAGHKPVATAAAAGPIIVTCDSVEPVAAKDPRDPYLRYVIPADVDGVAPCVLGDKFGPDAKPVEIRFID
jgi:hypothetical protein